MHVVTIVGASRGAGGTTLAAWLSSCAAEAGPGLVVTLDAGLESALLAWARGNGSSRSIAAAWDDSCTAAKVRRLGDEGVDLVVIDCAPSPGSARDAEILDASDVVVIVVQPLGSSLDHVGELLDTVEAADKAFVFVVNQATDDEEMTAATVISLAQYGTVAPVVLPRYDACKLPGRSPSGNGDAGTPAVSEDMWRLWEYLHDGLRSHAETGPDAAPYAEAGVEAPRYDRPATFVVPEMVYPCHVIDITSQGLVFTSEHGVPPGVRLLMNLPYVGQISCDVAKNQSGKMVANFVIDEARRSGLLDQVALLVEYSRDNEVLVSA